jgi:hypothetical protein
MVASDTTDNASDLDVYEDIYDFIVKVFPQAHERLINEKKTPVAEFLENADSAFKDELASIINLPTQSATGNGGVIGFFTRKIKKIKRIWRHA